MLEGTHDFGRFRSSICGARSTVRELHACRILEVTEDSWAWGYSEHCSPISPLPPFSTTTTGVLMLLRDL